VGKYRTAIFSGHIRRWGWPRIAVGATSQTYFSLFSLLSYSPAVHVAAIGLLLMLLGSFQYLESAAPL
jgi:hypothetical protein